MRTILFMFLALMLAAGTACGDDDGSTDSGTDSSVGDTSTGDTSTGDTSTGDSSTGDSSTGDSSTGDAGDAGGDGGGDAGDGGGSSADAIAFCDTYETVCTFGGDDRFADEAACETYYDSSLESCTSCIETHLGLAADDAAMHCPHATGAAPCSGMGCTAP